MTFYHVRFDEHHDNTYLYMYYTTSPYHRVLCSCNFSTSTINFLLNLRLILDDNHVIRARTAAVRLISREQ